MPALTPQALVAALQWRYATKKFDPGKRIPDADWNALQEALRLTPSSIGLQPWRFVVVTDAKLKQALLPASRNQAQTADCSHFVVFAVRRDVDAEHVDRHVRRMAEIRSVPLESLDKFRAMASGNLSRAEEEGRLDTWQTHQIYIALGNFMTSAAVLGIDTCPMEGIVPAEMDKVLGLEDAGFATVVACAAGYRAADDKYATIPKVRFPIEEIIDRR